MSIAGHVSRAMLSRYSHVRIEAKRRALDETAARQRATDEEREEEASAAGGSCARQTAGERPVGLYSRKVCRWRRQTLARRFEQQENI
jgi:hypothetical protein